MTIAATIPRFTDLPASTLLVGPELTWESLSASLKTAVHTSDFWSNTLEKPLTIAEIRELHRFAEQTPVGQEKIACLYQADLLKAESANALLKLLEEPPAYLKLVLFAESKRLLPTLLSRLTVLVLPTGPSNSEFEQWRLLLESYSVDVSSERKRLQELLYLLPLMHSGIQQASVREAFSPRN